MKPTKSDDEFIDDNDTSGSEYIQESYSHCSSSEIMNGDNEEEFFEVEGGTDSNSEDNSDENCSKSSIRNSSSDSECTATEDIVGSDLENVHKGKKHKEVNTQQNNNEK